MSNPSSGHGGRSALERLGQELAARDAERETREMLKVARIEARRDRAGEALAELQRILAGLWNRVAELAPMTIAYSPQRLELELAAIEWDIEHEYVDEQSFARSGWDVFAGAWIRLHQRSIHEYPGMSASLWFAQLPGQGSPAWHEVAYDAEEGNAPAEEPFALRDVIKADMVASSEASNLYVVSTPLRLEGASLEAFYDRWMGLLAAAAVGELERPAPMDAEMRNASSTTTPLQDAVAQAEQPPAKPEVKPGSLFGRLRSVGD